MEKVFISYSHDSEEHMALVLEFSELLREYGIDAVLDQYVESPLDGWPKWMDIQIKKAEFVIIIFTERYWHRVNGIEENGSGLGVNFESTLTYAHIYYDKKQVYRFIPVVFTKSDFKYIPTPLKGLTSYCVDNNRGTEALFRRLTKNPFIRVGPLGQRSIRTPTDPKTANFASSLTTLIKEAYEKHKPGLGAKEENSRLSERTQATSIIKESIEEKKQDHLLSAVYEKLGDDYDFESGRIGTGTYSKVYLVRHTIFKEDYALKIMDFDFIAQSIRGHRIENIKEEYEKRKESFEEKVRFFNKFKGHPNILYIVDSGFIPYEYKGHVFKVPYMLSKYINGVNLKECIQEEGPLGWENVFNISEQILLTIDKYQQAGYFYWRVRPEKILIHGERSTPVLLDPALSEYLPGETDFTGTKIIINIDLFNSTQYLSFFTGTWREREIASVICLFGVLLYEMVTGDREVRIHSDFLENLYSHLNAPGFTLDDRNLDLPGGIESIIKKAVSRDAEQRYKSLGEILADLKSANESLSKNKEE